MASAPSRADSISIIICTFKSLRDGFCKGQWGEGREIFHVLVTDINSAAFNQLKNPDIASTIFSGEEVKINFVLELQINKDQFAHEGASL